MSNHRPQKGTPGYEAYRAKCREYARKWQAEHRDRVRAYSKRWRARNPGRVREDCRKYYARHRAESAERVRKWRKANPDRVRAHVAKWRAKNPDRIREYSRLPHVVLAARVSERERRAAVYESYESYEAHDAYLLRAAAYRRRAGIVKADSPYIPRIGRRIPPTWMRRYCDRYAPEAQGVEEMAFVRETMAERREWAHAHNAI